MNSRWSGRHVISLSDCSREDLLDILKVARYCRQTSQNPATSSCLNGAVIGTLFFEPSTRTRLSFEAATKKMGGGIIGFSDSSSTSTKKGETLADTMSMVSRYVDAIVMRHPRDGAARLAADHSLVPIINGGDGANQHPTQTFLDLSTIDDFFPGRLENGPPLLVALAGDLRYGRTVHSLAQALTHFQAEIILSPVPGLEMPVHHIEHLQAAGITVHADTSLAEAAKNADVLYMTRLQRERFADPVEFDHVSADYCLTGEMLQHAKPGLRVLHPLPRVKEISAEVDGTPHAAYFEQAGNGVAVRQAVLALVMGRLDPDHLPQVSPSKAGT